MTSKPTISTPLPFPLKIGVVGAGTMGAGIALTALRGEIPVALQDISEDALGKARDYIMHHLVRKGLEDHIKLLETSQEFDILATADVVIEAAIEDLDVKLGIFRAISDRCNPHTILATNTSTLSVGAIAAVVENPQRVAGMHFFNPAPVLPLVEIVQAAGTSAATINFLVNLAEKMGKTPVVTRDSPGFIVNRVARPFYGEALRLLAEGVASVDEIDTLMESGGGFPMGPFRLMDLIGTDVNFTAMQSMYDQTFFEPRYQPHWVQSSMVGSGALGRKSGRGFYSYDPDKPAEAKEMPEVPLSGPKRLWVSPGSWAPGLAKLCIAQGHQVVPIGAEGPEPDLVVLLAGRNEGLFRLLNRFEKVLSPDTPLLCQIVDVRLAELNAHVAHPDRVLGFDGLFLKAGGPISLSSPNALPVCALESVEQFVLSLDCWPVWIKDSAGMVIPRIIAMLANEAAFAAQEGVASPNTIDLAMRLGVNYPLGPLEWGRALSWSKIAAILEHLLVETGAERYRLSPSLREWARFERAG